MTEKRNLHDYLRHWNDHLIPDVEGQSAASEHLDGDQLQALTKISKEMLKNTDADLEHLSSCPSCMERWAELCRQKIANNAEDTPATNTISFGEMDADVEGQSAEQLSISSCQRFILKQSINEDTLVLSLTSKEPAYDSQTVKLCDRHGNVAMRGCLEQGELKESKELPNSLDLTVWTLVVSPN